MHKHVSVFNRNLLLYQPFRDFPLFTIILYATACLLASLFTFYRWLRCEGNYQQQCVQEWKKKKKKANGLDSSRAGLISSSSSYTYYFFSSCDVSDMCKHIISRINSSRFLFWNGVFFILSLFVCLLAISLKIIERSEREQASKMYLSNVFDIYKMHGCDQGARMRTNRVQSICVYSLWKQNIIGICESIRQIVKWHCRYFVTR